MADAETLVLGLDVGTTAAKAVVVDGRGRVRAKGRVGYPTHTPAPGRSEQDPEDWWRAAVAAARQALSAVDAGRVRALALSTQGGSSCLVDGRGRPLTPALTWMDARAGAEVGELLARHGPDFFYTRTGWPLSAGLDAAKARWLARHEADAFARAVYFVSTPEYIQHRLCGVWAVDPTNAAIRQLLNVAARAWDAEVLDAVGLAPARLAPVRPAGEWLGTLAPEAARELGLMPDVPVLNGAHDQYCAALGAGLARSGDRLVATGTTWVLFGLFDEPPFSPARLAVGPHLADGLWGGLVSLVGCGTALDWFRTTVARTDETAFDAWLHEAAGRRERAAGLLFAPWFHGAGFPFGRPDARAGLAGLEARHDAHDLLRAVLEGPALWLRAALAAFPGGGAGGPLRLAGGAAAGEVWPEVLAAALGVDVARLEEPDASAFGAALLAGVGIGLFPGFAQAASFARVRPVPPPAPEVRAFYDEKFARFERFAKGS